MVAYITVACSQANMFLQRTFGQIPCYVQSILKRLVLCRISGSQSQTYLWSMFGCAWYTANSSTFNVQSNGQHPPSTLSMRMQLRANINHFISFIPHLHCITIMCNDQLCLRVIYSWSFYCCNAATAMHIQCIFNNPRTCHYAHGSIGV